MTVLSDEQGEIIRELGVAAEIDPEHEIERRTEFLKDYLVASGMRGYVLGISGGVDSLTAALIAQKAVRELRHSGHAAEFIAVRLPYGVQADEADAARALETIGADRTIVVNIKAAADGMLAAAQTGGLAFADAGRQDFILGNIKARQRMIAQFALAGALGGLVIGTDHAAEAVMGFFTKFGDGAADILPLAGLNKRRVRLLAKRLGAPDELVFKVPTADLEDQRPLRPDEEAYGVTYDEIDDFLEGKPVGEIARRRILAAYRATAHKRALPVAVNAL
ncbi:ammonia-dependent NAD(+) synthetase [Rhizobium hidalgonense]|uniref:NH(3)-dependent NAD(+) synthetase n=1 Tax=Rhizobium hidalgonense TaxID=1538159 RepID=A0A2A6K4B2_9HYPH|nr:ammonia-dependent NAD(+) synthetase [Rhizobium hidalgonense]EJC73729.1 NAD+ synthetase [Rhizobium leguminosarum bv. trifolii WSM2012]MDR9776858.1 ammonia-dependent NAD(+) synthetase [Rhizobium hidalgonense]MDR9807815.1 ammonia-dependent NAD(+) synthetase [Rhizobium hidalgonense]MDR9813277.1 ammonia-dependent NAD(+) synthetase [Rhizobium hidalgonense]MDR9821283.1 ammonia-dependent NAD(+) synthetase [Rhizobium hidalgonense]